MYKQWVLTIIFKDEISPQKLLSVVVCATKQYSILLGENGILTQKTTGKGVEEKILRNIGFLEYCDVVVNDSRYFGK